MFSRYFVVAVFVVCWCCCRRMCVSERGGVGKWWDGVVYIYSDFWLGDPLVWSAPSSTVFFLFYTPLIIMCVCMTVCMTSICLFVIMFKPIRQCFLTDTLFESRGIQ